MKVISLQRRRSSHSRQYPRSSKASEQTSHSLRQSSIQNELPKFQTPYRTVLLSFTPGIGLHLSQSALALYCDPLDQLCSLRISEPRLTSRLGATLTNALSTTRIRPRCPVRDRYILKQTRCISIFDLSAAVSSIFPTDDLAVQS